ncbi:serrate RNA effector molecule -like protein [Brachionus plicatilis]|uniref:Serrate RNA effector molecule-like protein n=1 Tax=Brachionus plicatilis TaxID=10195 RepID=A0A3M7RJU0_BRAPC|nr:serrate RNA effector molecule -like protein [Brachionus plicatilis]
MKIIQNMDKKWAIWQQKEEVKSVTQQQVDVKTECKEEEADKEDPARVQEEYAKLEESGFSALPAHHSAHIEHNFHGANPLLQNITDYLVDEANAEESELLGHDQAHTKPGADHEIDEQFLKALDKLIVYLRVVHSIDFYNAIEYQQEDWMPNRLGIVFVRPPLNANYRPKSDEVEEYVKSFESKVKPYVEYRERIEVEMARRLGLKDRKQEIEKFVQTNTQELAPDRWLCPLSGKRFKGAEFIRKHLFYKHMEKIVDVKKEVEYFNSYLMDPKRPQLPEHPSNRPAAQSAVNHGQGQHQSYQQYPGNQPVNYTSPGIMNQMAAAAGYQQMRPGWSGPAYNNMNDNMAQNYNQSAFNSQFGYQGFQAGFKKNPYQAQSQQNSFQRRGQREMIQYKDLDAPDDL